MSNHELNQSMKSILSQSSTTPTSQNVTHNYHYHFHYFLDQSLSKLPIQPSKRLRRMKSLQDINNDWKSRVNPLVNSTIEEIKKEPMNLQKFKEHQPKQQLRELLRKTSSTYQISEQVRQNKFEPKSQSQLSEILLPQMEQIKLLKKNNTHSFKRLPNKSFQTNRFYRQNKVLGTQCYSSSYEPQCSVASVAVSSPAVKYVSPTSQRAKLMQEECIYLRNAFMKRIQNKHLGELK